MAELEAERDDIRQRLNTMLRILKGPALEDAEDEVAGLVARRNAIEARLTTIRKDQNNELRPVETVVAEALQVLAEGSEQLLKLPIEPLRKLVDRFVGDATVDMETKTVEFKMNLPTWVLEMKWSAPQESRRRL